MYTARVLGEIGANEPVLQDLPQFNQDGGKLKLHSILQWLGNSIYNFPPTVPIRETKDTEPLQQTDLMRKFYLTIAEHGLHAAFKEAEK